MNLFVEEMLYIYKLKLEPKHKTGSEERAIIKEYSMTYRGPGFLAVV
jgi:hypothetical protein